MKAIVIVDDSDGLLLNHRRQSRDRSVVEDICKQVSSTELYIDKYSNELFNLEGDTNIVVLTNYEERVPDNAYVFFESDQVNMKSNQINELIIYKWNRLYPADVYLEVNYADWRKVSSTDFKGYSHEKITKEVYKRSSK